MGAIGHFGVGDEEGQKVMNILVMNIQHMRLRGCPWYMSGSEMRGRVDPDVVEDGLLRDEGGRDGRKVGSVRSAEWKERLGSAQSTLS